MVHGVGEFFEGSFEGKWLPAFAAIQRQAVGTAAQRSESEPWVGAILIDTANDQMPAAGSHREAVGCLTCVEHRLQRRNHCR